MALDRVVVPIKLGDKQTAPTKEYLRVHDGMPIGYISEREWNLPLSQILSPHMQRVYAFVEFPESDIPLLRQYQTPIGLDNGSPNPSSFRYASTFLDINNIPSHIQSNWRDPNSIKPIVSKDAVHQSNFISSSSLAKASKTPDHNAVAEGSYTIGASQDYATVAAAFADIANLTADLTFTIKTPTTENAESDFTENLNNHTFTLSSDPHFGSYSLGHLITLNPGAAANFLHLQQEGPGTTHIKNLKYIVSNLSMFIRLENVAAAFNLYISHILGNCNSQNYNEDIRILDPTPIPYLFSSIFFNKLDSTPCLGFSAPNASAIIENVTCYNCNDTAGDGHSFDCGNDPITLYNCLSLNSGGNGFINIGNATGRNNASDDASCQNANWNVGTNNLINLTPANEVRSTTLTDNPLFLLPILNSNIYDGGLAFAIGNHERYITRFLGHTPWAIGAKQVYPPFNHSSISQPGVTA